MGFERHNGYLLRTFAVRNCSVPAAVKRILITLTSLPPPQVFPQANLYRNVFKSHLPVRRMNALESADLNKAVKIFILRPCSYL